MSWILDEYYCPDCYHTEEHLNKRKDRPALRGECPDCGIAMRKATVGGHFCLVADGGGSRFKMADTGRLSTDQAAREKERLMARSRTFAHSKKGEEIRMAQRDRLGERWGTTLPEAPFRSQTRKSI